MSGSQREFDDILWCTEVNIAAPACAIVHWLYICDDYVILWANSTFLVAVDTFLLRHWPAYSFDVLLFRLARVAV